MRKISSENGSMAVYVSVVLLSMLLILLAIFLISNQLRKAQIETVLGIKHSYEDDIEKADEIYANITGSTANIDYVEDGLILHYDAINNTGSGHSNNITTWKDLSGNSNDAIITGGIWENNSLRFTNAVLQFITIENSNLKQLAANLGLNEDVIEKIPNTIVFENYSLDKLNFSEEEKNTEINRYLAVL